MEKSTRFLSECPNITEAVFRRLLKTSMLARYQQTERIGQFLMICCKNSLIVIDIDIQLLLLLVFSRQFGSRLK